MSFWSAKRPIAIAHRGGAAAYASQKHKVENTLEAFAAAVRLGYEYLELDVIKTADDKIIVVHVAKNWFESIFKKKDAPGYPTLQKLTYQQIKQRLGRDIPTLDQVLVKFPKTKLLVETKTEAVLRPAIGSLKAHKALDRVCLISFYPERLEKLRALAGPGVPLGLNISSSPLHQILQARKLKNTAWRDQVQLSYVGWPIYYLTKRDVSMMHGWGLPVFVYPPNTVKSINKALGAGADGIISDNISLLKKIVDERIK